MTPGRIVSIVFALFIIYFLGSSSGCSGCSQSLLTPTKDTNPNSAAQVERRARYEAELKAEAARAAERKLTDEEFTKRIAAIGFTKERTPGEYVVFFFNDSKRPLRYTVQRDNVELASRLEVPPHDHRFIIFNTEKTHAPVDITEHTTGRKWREGLAHSVWGYTFK
jgi:hypothetical protein